METLIFYWTGVAIWWGIQLCAIAAIVSAVVFTPIYVFNRVRKHWWGWATMGKFADLGWTQKEIKEIVNHVRVDDAWQRTAAKVLEKADEIKKRV